jgi:hypothetical protein
MIGDTVTASLEAIVPLVVLGAAGQHQRIVPLP